MAVLNIFLQFVSAVLALAAAVYWAKSARVQIPEQIIANVLRPNGRMPSVMGATFVGVVQSPSLDDLVTQLSRQSHLSGLGAAYASAAAIAQVATAAISNWPAIKGWFG